MLCTHKKDSWRSLIRTSVSSEALGLLAGKLTLLILLPYTNLILSDTASDLHIHMAYQQQNCLPPLAPLRRTNAAKSRFQIPDSRFQIPE